MDARRSPRLAVALVIALLCTAVPAPARAAGCQGDPGFQLLQALLPDVVGDCTGFAYANPLTGDTIQPTTRGTLVRPRGDGWPTFTDGQQTWIDGPAGLAVRPSTARFPWETPSTPCVLAGSDFRFSEAVTGPDGDAVGTATFRNPCDVPVSLMLDILTRAVGSDRPLADAPTIFLASVPPGAARTFGYRIPRIGPDSTAQTTVTWFAGPLNRWTCIQVGAEGCLLIDPWLASAVNALADLDEGRALLRIAAASGARLLRAPTADGLIASYTPATRVVTLDPALDRSSSWVRAAVLAHELQHVADVARNALDGSPDSCYAAETTAYRRQAAVWARLWQEHLPPTLDAPHAMLNTITLTVSRDPDGFARSLIQAYRSECGG
jgi:hypothetical protein